MEQCRDVENSCTDMPRARSWTLYDLFDFLAWRGIYGVPVYHLLLEIGLIIWLVRLLLARKVSPRDRELPLSEKEKDELIAEWKPEPLVPPANPEDELLPRPLLDGKVAKYVSVVLDNEARARCLNAASFNFLNLVGRPEIEEEARKTICIYGVGSCGPRGFYGTAEIHLELERRLAKFFDLEESALYSFGFATISSAIPSYSKRGDVIFADEGVCFAIQQGILASRSHVYYFKHNDVDDLRRLLEDQKKRDKKDPGRAVHTRRFLVIEGLYAKSGDVCPLPKLIKLKHEYKLRMLLDESFSFGTLGTHGRGVTEHFGVSAKEVDAIIGSLENAVPAGGGFVVGSSYVVDHQRLSGSGYCFSASLPPLLAASALKCINIFAQESELFSKLRQRSKKMHEELQSKLPRFKVDGDSFSPLKHLRMRYGNGNWYEKENLLRQMTTWIISEKHVLLTTAAYCEKSEHRLPDPSIRINVNVDFSDSEIETIVEALREASEKFLP